MTFQVYRFPLATSGDLKITLGDATVSTDAAYTGITVTYSGTPFARTIGGVSYNFDVEIDGNGQSIAGIYETIQYRLRQSADIDDGVGTVTGNVTDDLAFFVGDTIKLREGVFLTNFAASDTNDIYTTPSVVLSILPSPSPLLLNFSSVGNLVSDTDAVYRVFFTNDDAGDNTGRDFGTANAMTVEDNTSTAMSGLVGGVTSCLTGV